MGRRIKENRLLSILATLLFLGPAAFCHADSSTLTVGATVVSRGFCWFAANKANLNFGVLDPGSPADVTAGTTVNFRCFGFPSVIYAVADDGGLYKTGSGGNRMRHATVSTEYLPYSMDVSPRSATVSWNPFVLHALTVSGTVRGADYQGAYAGNYSDTVVISINP